MNFQIPKRALRSAFPKTIPIFTGFFFLGVSYGIYMRQFGFSFLYPMLTALVVYGGSLEFIIVSLLLSPFAPLQTLLMALVIQLRHMFYGISMLEKYQGTGWKKFFLIFGMSDETFSVNYTADVPSDVDRPWFYLCTTWLNQLYWVGSSALGGIIGDKLPFDPEGIDFVMTAMFVVIFLDQVLKEKQHISSAVGLLVSVLCLILFGANSFLVPTMVCILMCLSFLRRPIEIREFPEPVPPTDIPG